MVEGDYLRERFSHIWKQNPIKYFSSKLSFIMKTSSFFRSVRFAANLVLAVMLMGHIASCDSIHQQESSRPNENRKELSQEFAWQRLLSSCIEKPMYGCDLSLTGYNVVGKISSAEEKQRYLDKCFASSSYFAIFDNDKKNTNVASQLELASNNNFDISYFTSYRQHIADKIANGIYDMVELQWSYKGESFKTYAIVSESEIIHDNVFVASNPKMSSFVNTQSRSSLASGSTKVTVERKKVIMSKSELKKKCKQE